MVGGGISGLYCASVLSKHGHKVTVFDLGKHAPGVCFCGGRPCSSDCTTQGAQQHAQLLTDSTSFCSDQVAA